MRLRRRSLRLPQWLAKPIAGVLAAGVRATPDAHSGCLLVEARKRP